MSIDQQFTSYIPRPKVKAKLLTCNCGELTLNPERSCAMCLVFARTGYTMADIRREMECDTSQK